MGSVYESKTASGMRRNKLRELLNSNQPSLATHVHSTWPAVVEMIGHTGVFDYVEFVAEYGPFDLYSLDDFCRAVELFDMSCMIKIDQEPRQSLAQRGIGAGFQSVLFADCRNVEDVRECVNAVRAETPESDGTYGVAVRRFAYMGHAGKPEYVEYLKDVVVALMIEKKTAVEDLEAILSLEGIDMIQWGSADYAMSIGRAGEFNHPEVKEAERHVIETCLKKGIPPRAEIYEPEGAEYYLNMGVRHFCIGTDIQILFNWLKNNGEQLRKIVGER